jgi:hypothetical protein
MLSHSIARYVDLTSCLCLYVRLSVLGVAHSCRTEIPFYHAFFIICAINTHLQEQLDESVPTPRATNDSTLRYERDSVE